MLGCGKALLVLGGDKGRAEHLGRGVSEDGEPGFAFGPLPNLSRDRRRLLPRRSISGMSCSKRSSQEGFLGIFLRIFLFLLHFMDICFHLMEGTVQREDLRVVFPLHNVGTPSVFVTLKIWVLAARDEQVIFHCSLAKVICRYYLARDFCHVYCQAFIT